MPIATLGFRRKHKASFAIARLIVSASSSSASAAAADDPARLPGGGVPLCACCCWRRPCCCVGDAAGLPAERGGVFRADPGLATALRANAGRNLACGKTTGGVSACVRQRRLCVLLMCARLFYSAESAGGRERGRDGCAIQAEGAHPRLWAGFQRAQSERDLSAVDDGDAEARSALSAVPGVGLRRRRGGVVRVGERAFWVLAEWRSGQKANCEAWTVKPTRSAGALGGGAWETGRERPLRSAPGPRGRGSRARRGQASLGAVARGR